MNDEMKHLILRTEKAISLPEERRTHLRQWDAELYAKELDLIREDIGFISNHHSEEAKNLMLDFIAAGCFIVSKTTVKDSTICDLFQKCVEDLAGILSKIPANSQEIADVVCRITCMPDFSYGYGYYFNNDAVSTFKELLSKDDGFDRLKNGLTEKLRVTKKKNHEFISRIERVLNKIARYRKLS
ncbi:MAG: hypothetical protein LBJ96_03375 [Holosporaceae bacterium]|jgi:hypothetical protein|nr:hypothetical protein [Holosporaceae bacterium]